MTSIAIFEDHPLLRESLSELVGIMPDMELVGAWPDCTRAEYLVQTHKPDIVLMDIDMPGMTGIEGTRQIKAVAPQTDILMLTVFEDEARIYEAMCAGATGYLLKKTPAHRIMDAIREVVDGGAPMSPAVARKVIHFFASGNVRAKSKADPPTGLTPRESEILSWLVKGHSYKMIAAECAISIDTVRAHLKKIYKKLHVHSMTEAVAKAIREQLV